MGVGVEVGAGVGVGVGVGVTVGVGEDVSTSGTGVGEGANTVGVSTGGHEPNPVLSDSVPVVDWASMVSRTRIAVTVATTAASMVARTSDAGAAGCKTGGAVERGARCP